jgi:lipopolysaccharide export system permease protein
VALAVIGVVALRIAGFAASSAAVRSPAGVIGIYAAPLGAIAIAVLLIFQNALKRRLTHGLSVALGRIALPRLPGLSKA